MRYWLPIARCGQKASTLRTSLAPEGAKHHGLATSRYSTSPEETAHRTNAADAGMYDTVLAQPSTAA